MLVPVLLDAVPLDEDDEAPEDAAVDPLDEEPSEPLPEDDEEDEPDDAPAPERLSVR